VALGAREPHDVDDLVRVLDDGDDVGEAVRLVAVPDRGLPRVLVPLSALPVDDHLRS